MKPPDEKSLVNVRSHSPEIAPTSEVLTAQEMVRYLASRYQLQPAIHVKILTIGGREMAYVTPDGWCSIAKCENASIEFDSPFIEEVLGQKALCVKCRVITGKEPNTRRFEMIGAVPITGILAELLKKVHTNAMARAMRFALGLSVIDDVEDTSEERKG